MCFFRKKKKEELPPIDSKFKMGESIMFRNNRGELVNGYVYGIHQQPDGLICYDLQIGGECPVIYENISEDKIIKRPIKN